MTLRTSEPRTAKNQNELIARFNLDKEPAGSVSDILDFEEEMSSEIYRAALVIDVSLDDSREKSMALTKLEEAQMWAMKAAEL